MAEEYFQGEVIAPKAYVGKMVHYYHTEATVNGKLPSAAVICYVSPIAVDLYVFPDYARESDKPHGEFGRTYSPYPRAGFWTEIPNEAG